MERKIIELNDLTKDGRLYRNPRLDTVEALIPNAPFGSCHAADLLETEEGDILAVWFAGTEEGNSDISIVLSRLDKGSDRWTDPVKVSDDDTRSEQNPSLFQKKDGEIWLIYTAQVARTPENNPFFNLQYTAEIRRRRSRDNGHTWSDTEVMFSHPGSFCRQKIQVLSNGRWLFGNWYCFDDKSRNGSDITVVHISDDEGETWRDVEMPRSMGKVHANLIEMDGGRVVALMRSRSADYIYRSVSEDWGESWSIPEKTELPNNNSSISAIRLQSGAIAMVFNPVGYGHDTSITLWPDQRCPVEVAISEDEGISWNYRRIVEHGEGYCGRYNDINNLRYEYPVMMQARDGEIYVAYSSHYRKNIKFVQISEEWIRGSRIFQGLDGLKDTFRHY